MIHRNQQLDQLLFSTINASIINTYLKMCDFGYFMIFHPDFQGNTFNPNLNITQLEEELDRYKQLVDDKNNMIASYTNVSVSFHFFDNGKRVYFINAKPEEVIKQLTQLHKMKAFQ